MKNAIIISFLLLAIAFFLNPHLFKKNQIKNKHAYTTAICNSHNYCEDYVINCEGNQLKKITPTGFSIQKEPNWKDSREKIQKYCN